ncbi:MAG: hypothetical protein RIQ56_827 [Candidatus Parcubacteria bacterium]|jgi:hypothetical protein
MIGTFAFTVALAFWVTDLAQKYKDAGIVAVATIGMFLVVAFGLTFDQNSPHTQPFGLAIGAGLLLGVVLAGRR